MDLADNGAGWLVGDGGLVLNTTDAGRTWSTTEGVLPDGANTQFDYGALATIGPHVWIAGTPGTRVLHSPDGGPTWESSSTGQSLPIHALSFVDEQHGWAVGELGTILATKDGGRTWHKQRSHATRAAIAGFFARPEQLPTELLAKLSADEGYLSAMEVLNREEVEIRSPQGREAIVHEAASAAGASAGLTAWRFPLRSAALKLSAERLIEDWNRVNDGQGIEKLEAAHRLAAANVAAQHRGHRGGRCSRSTGPGDQPGRAQRGRAGRRSNPLFRADHRGRPRALESAEGLCGAVGRRRNGQHQHRAGHRATGAFDRRTLGAGPRTRCPGVYARVPERRVPAAGRSYSAGGRRARLLQRHHDLARQRCAADVSEGSQNNLAAAQREAQRFRNLQAILELADKRGEEGHFLANLGDQTRDLEPDRTAQVMFQLAKRYWVKGRADMAAECYEVLVERHATHPLAARPWPG